MMRTIRQLLGVFLLTTLASPAYVEPAPVLGRPVPFEILDPPWLDERERAQLATKPDFDAFIDFAFDNKLGTSGIEFRNRVVADAGVTYKAVHYDHGNGLAVADVDGDDRYDIYFVNQVGRNELWRNLGDGRFEDITTMAGVGVDDRISVTASFADIDNDGDPDLYVTTVRDGNVLFENRGDGTFRDISSSSGLDYSGHSSGAVFFDYDRDGLVDVFLTNVGQYTSEEVRRAMHGEVAYRFYDGFGDAFGGHNFPERTEKSRLYRNLGDGRFEDRSEIFRDFEPAWSGDAIAVDVNRDGWLDLYQLNMQGHDQYYENRGGEAFIRKSREVFPKTSWGAMGIKAFDWNNDGDLDIYITDMHSDMSKDVGPSPEEEWVKSDMQWNESHLGSGGMSVFGNTFFDNRGDGSFEEISDDIGVENYWPWGLSVGDVNADGYQDIFVTLSMNYPFRYQSNTLLINDRGERFRPAEFIVGIEPRQQTAQPWFDIQCRTEQDHRLCVEAAGRHVQAWGARGSRSSVMFDLDDDGDLDLVTNEFNAAPMVFVSNLSAKREINYLKVRLEGTQSNRAGLGARVTVRTGENEQVQVLDGKSGYLSQSLKPLYFGLGMASDIDEVRVEWPSGARQVIEKPAMNKLMTITEPDQSP